MRDDRYEQDYKDRLSDRKQFERFQERELHLRRIYEFLRADCRIPAKQKQVMMLRLYEYDLIKKRRGYSFGKISKMMGIAKSTAHYLFGRGMKAFREWCKEQGDNG